MTVRIRTIALIGIVLVAIGISLIRRTDTTIGAFAAYVTQPITTGVHMVSRSWQRVRASFSSAQTLAQRIEELERENHALRADHAALSACRTEVSQLKSECEIPVETPVPPYTYAGIIAYDSHRIPQWFVVNRGSRDGVHVGDAVSDGSGVLLGTVVSVKSVVSRVATVAKAQSVVRARGAIHGTALVVHGTAHGAVVATLADRTQPLSEGEELVTVRDGAIPEGLLIGTVRTVHETPDKLFQEAMVQVPTLPMMVRRVALIRAGNDNHTP